MHSTNYTDTFIAASPDCAATQGTAPPRTGTVAALQHDLLTAAPYTRTSDDLLVAVTALRKGIPAEQHDALRADLFAKGQPCLRASPLVKTYGWGLHHDAQGRVALYGRDTADYARLSADQGLTQLQGMRSHR